MNVNINYDYDLIIVGAGPAGLSAAIYAQRGTLKVAIVEKLYAGGKMMKTSEIENYPGFNYIMGPELSQVMADQVDKLSVPILYEEVLEIIDGADHKSKIVKTTYRSYIVKAVLIATGTLERTIGAKNEDTYYGKGVSYCAVCDAALYKDKIITVVGGGYGACEEALYVTKYSDQVNLIHRRREFRADSKTVEKVMNNPKINLILDHQVLEVLPREDQKVIDRLKIANTITKEETIIPTDVMFPYIGSEPVTKMVSSLGVCDENDYIIADNTCQTKIPGLFAAGDVIAKNLRQIVTATSDGAIAAQFIINFIDNYID